MLKQHNISIQLAKINTGYPIVELFRSSKLRENVSYDRPATCFISNTKKILVGLFILSSFDEFKQEMVI